MGELLVLSERRDIIIRNSSDISYDYSIFIYFYYRIECHDEECKNDDK